MSNDLKKILGILILTVGFFAFLISIVNNDLNFALIFLTTTLILWVIVSLLVDLFDLRLFAIIISISGFLVAISIFFLFGIEEIPYPVGAIIFHTEGIATFLIISLFSFFPLILIYNNSENSHKLLSKKSEIVKKNPLIDDDDWEIADDDDLFSEEFELG